MATVKSCDMCQKTTDVDNMLKLETNMSMKNRGLQTFDLCDECLKLIIEYIEA